MQPTPVFLPGESHGQRSLAGYSPRNRKESDIPRVVTGASGIVLCGGMELRLLLELFTPSVCFLGVSSPALHPAPLARVPHFTALTLMLVSQEWTASFWKLRQSHSLLHHPCPEACLAPRECPQNSADTLQDRQGLHGLFACTGAEATAARVAGCFQCSA